MRLKKIKRRAAIFINDIAKLKWMLAVFVVVPNVCFLTYADNLSLNKFIGFNSDILQLLFSFFAVAFFYALTRERPQEMSELVGFLLFVISICTFVVLSFSINILFNS